jgi:hypothetical protein
MLVKFSHPEEENRPSISGTVTWMNRKFDYAETSSGTNRGIQVSEQGVKASLHSYSLKVWQPSGTLGNIHNTGSVYNKNQAGFYPGLALAITKKVTTQQKWPASGWEFTFEKDCPRRRPLPRTAPQPAADRTERLPASAWRLEWLAGDVHCRRQCRRWSGIRKLTDGMRRNTGPMSTTASFSEPGEYVLLVQANDWTGKGGTGFQCCWTNAQVKVTVTPATGTR